MMKDCNNLHPIYPLAQTALRSGAVSGKMQADMGRGHRMIRKLLLSLGTAVALAVTPAVAQSDMLYDPQPAYMAAPAMTAPDLFSGAYAGAAIGLQVNHFGTFYGVGTNYRVPASVFAGYNYALTPFLLAGVEAQLEGTYDPWSNVAGYNAFGLARLGVLTSPDFMVYQTAGIGLIDGTPAYALGLGIEQSVNENFSLRFESLVHGQVPGSTRGRYWGGFTGMELALGALWYLDGNPARSGWHAGSNTEPPTDFTGLYAGFYAGGINNPNYAFFPGRVFNGWHMNQFAQGAMVGYDFAVGGPFRLGVEAQGGLFYDTSGDAGLEGFALARAGVVPIDGLLVYANGGVGAINNYGAYALGGGAEYALWGDTGVRIEAQAIGQMPPRLPKLAGFNTTKFTVGTVWHLN